MCFGVGFVVTVYHPMNSNEGKTCLSKRTGVKRGNVFEKDEKTTRTLISARDEKVVVYQVRIVIDDRELEGVDDFEFASDLCAKKCA